MLVKLVLKIFRGDFFSKIYQFDKIRKQLLLWYRSQ